MLTAARSNHRATLSAAVGRLQARFPGLQVTMSRSNTEARFTMATPFLAGRIYSDGTVTIERMGNITADRFAAVLQAITS